MQSWMNSISSVVMPVTAVLAVLFAGIKLWMDIRANAAISSDMAALKQSFVARHWLALMLVISGTGGMVGVLVVPLSPFSLLVAAVSAVLCAFGLSCVLVLETSLALIAGVFKYKAMPPNSD